jgi:hypothetical protein
LHSLVTLTTLAGVIFNKAMIAAVASHASGANPTQPLTVPRTATSTALSGTVPLLSLSPSDPPTPYAPLSFNITVVGGETFTYISARPPEGCEPEINGTFVDMQNVTYTSTTAVCDDDQGATVGLYMFGNDAYLLRSGNPSIADSLYQCTNITGYDGPQPPHAVRINLFDNGIHCAAAPTTAGPPSAAPDTAPLPTSRSVWLEVLPKVGAVGAGVTALIVCGCLVNRRLQARQVHPGEVHTMPASNLEMAPMRINAEPAVTVPTD